jgi:hypothetical protein
MHDPHHDPMHDPFGQSEPSQPPGMGGNGDVADMGEFDG